MPRNADRTLPRYLRHRVLKQVRRVAKELLLEQQRGQAAEYLPRFRDPLPSDRAKGEDEGDV